ncbi:MAG: hypothetical protein K2P80_07520 [Beijerinckiaceae bacterium]|nr:hypothetical protein [Beijerinckiaceae bacterium]
MVLSRLPLSALFLAVLVSAASVLTCAATAAGGFGSKGISGSRIGGFGVKGHGSARYGLAYRGQPRAGRPIGGVSFRQRPILTSRAQVGGYFPHPQTQYLYPVGHGARHHRGRDGFRANGYGYGYGGGYGYGYGGYSGYSARSGQFGTDGYQGSASYGADIDYAYAPPQTTRVKRGSRNNGLPVMATTQEAGFQSQASYNASYGYAAPRIIRVSP